MAGSIHGAQCVVLDCGSGTTKAGFAGDRSPSVIFPSVVGRHKSQSIDIEGGKNCKFVGNEALAKRGDLCCRYPVEYGFVTNWDDVEILWKHAFNELRVSSEENILLLCEPPLNPKLNREKSTELAFEELNCPAIYIANHATLAVYASGQLSGMVLESGDGATHPVPVYEGYAIPHAIMKVLINGRNVTYFLTELLNKSGSNFITTTDMEIVKDIKEKLCYVAVDFNRELEMSRKTPSAIEKRYELPDGRTISVGEERFMCAETYFDPVIMGYEMAGIHETIYNCIRRCCVDIRPTLFSNILISGGNTMFPGLGVRLEKEINKLAPDTERIHVNSYQDRQHFTFLGGCVLSSVSTFQDMLITKDDYDEYGPTYVHRKCF